MITATGKVGRITSKDVKTQFGVKAAYSANVGGTWFDFGFTKPRFNEGDNISFEYVDGTYGKKVSKDTVLVVAGTKTPTSIPLPSFNGKSFPIPPLHPDRSIVRQNSLTNAREVVCCFGEHYTETPAWYKIDDWAMVTDLIIDIARKFEAYSCGDLDVKRAEELSKNGD